MEIFVKIMGAIGLLLITAGVLNKNRLKQNYFFTTGGICLIIYSIYLKDPIFIPLQIIFTTASLYEIYILNQKKK